MQRAKVKAAELRAEKARTNPDNGKSFFESYKNKPSESKFTKGYRENLGLNFGAGEAKIEAGTIKEPTTPEMKKNYDEAKAEIENINGFIQYSEITAEANETGKTIVDVLSRRSAAGLENPANFDTQREKALDYIISTDVIQKGLPDFAKITNPDTKRKIIEQTLAADPALRAKVLKKMTRIREEAKNLPEPPASKEINDAKESKAEAETKVTENLKLVKDKLVELGFEDGSADTLSKDVEKYLKDGKSLDQVLGYLKLKSVEGLVGDMGDVQEYIKALNQIDKLEAKLGGYDTTTADEALVKNTRDQWEKAKDIISKFEEDPVLSAKFSKYQDIIGILNNQKDNSSSTAEGGIYLSPVAHGIDQIIKAQKTIINADKVIKEKGDLNTKSQEAWKAGRLEAESNLISEMKDTIQESIAEVLDARYDEMVGLEKQRMARVAEEEGKKGEKAIENGIKAVEYVKEHRWIEHNQSTGRKEVHRFTLGSDIKYAAYNGEEGIKRLILRDSGLKTKDAAGNPVDIDWRNVNMDTLPDDVKKTLEGVYGKAKDSYKQKLFGDFFLGKNALDRTIFGRSSRDLALTNDQYELLETKFKDVFTQSINSKVEAKAALEAIKSKGEKMNGGLFAILALLFGGAWEGIKRAGNG